MSWVPAENAYIELLLRSVTLSIKKDSSVAVSDKEDILEAFNEYFGGRSNLQNTKGGELFTHQILASQSFQSYLNRSHIRIRALRDSLTSLKNSNEVGAYIPEITDDKNAALIANGIIGAENATISDLILLIERTLPSDSNKFTEFVETTPNTRHPQIAQQTNTLGAEKGDKKSAALDRTV